MSDKPWTLAERFDYARYMAKSGKSKDEIMERCGLLELTAICIVNKERPGEIPTLAKNIKVES